METVFPVLNFLNRIYTVFLEIGTSSLITSISPNLVIDIFCTSEINGGMWISGSHSTEKSAGEHGLTNWEAMGREWLTQWKEMVET